MIQQAKRGMEEVTSGQRDSLEANGCFRAPWKPRRSATVALFVEGRGWETALVRVLYTLRTIGHAALSMVCVRIGI